MMFDVPLVALPVRLLFRLSCIMRIDLTKTGLGRYGTHRFRSSNYKN